MSVAAIILMKENRLVAAFRSASALTPATAVPMAELAVGEGLASRRLRKRAVIREAAPGSFYLDEEVWTAVRRTRRRVMVVLIVAALAGVGLLVAMRMI